MARGPKAQLIWLDEGTNMKHNALGLDFETYGSVDLPKHGLDRYVNDPYFQALIAHVTQPNPSGLAHYKFDFVLDGKTPRDLSQLIGDNNIDAHNSGFEAAVLQRMGIPVPAHRFTDTAVIARAAGAGGRLEAAAPQILAVDKMPEGWSLIKLFSMPGKYQEANGNMAFDPQIVHDHPDEWKLFNEYCMLDSKLSSLIRQKGSGFVTNQEAMFQTITMRMNQLGWPVDIPAVMEMQRRYVENQEAALADFRVRCDAPDLNVNSYPQLKQWCLDRGVRANSFDEKSVDNLERKLTAKLETLDPSDPKHSGYTDVLGLVQTKKILGGSSLKKLQTILDTTGADGRLRDQYLHAGAGQSMRTTGRSVQMQNLKRIAAEPRDMEELKLEASDWTNDEMAENMRQVFRASHDDGELIVGDFKSVESRSLAWQAEEHWKTHAYADGDDLYEVLARKIYGILPGGEVSKAQRQIGKVGELSCGYGAGPGAVRDFAVNYGVELAEGEATKLVRDWRNANTKIVDYWDALNAMLLDAVSSPVGRAILYTLPDAFELELEIVHAFTSLQLQTKGTVTKSLMVTVMDPDGGLFMRRMFVGIHEKGGDVRYFKPSDRKTGDLWKDTYINPKTKQLEHYKLYGGKLAGILTQSLCREVFFGVLVNVQKWVDFHPNVELIGQFHDEIVLDWWPDSGPNAVTLDYTKRQLELMMSNPGKMNSFPLAADVKSAFRYIK